LRNIRAQCNWERVWFDRALEVLRSGVKETEVAAEMEHAARRAGAQEMSFATIIASGARSALPHGRASESSYHAGRIRGLRFRCYNSVVIVRTKLAPYGWGTARMRRQKTRATPTNREGGAAGGDRGCAPWNQGAEVDEAARKY